MFTIAIYESTQPVTVDQDIEAGDGTILRYRQTVDTLDLQAVMAAVNKVPRKKRERKGGDAAT